MLIVRLSQGLKSKVLSKRYVFSLKISMAHQKLVSRTALFGVFPDRTRPTYTKLVSFIGKLVL